MYRLGMQPMKKTLSTNLFLFKFPSLYVLLFFVAVMLKEFILLYTYTEISTLTSKLNQNKYS